jgi:hypothetical protein
MADNEKKQRTISKRRIPLKKELLEYVSENGLIQIACRKVGICRQTYYRWRAADKSFARKADIAIRRGQEVGCDMAESVIFGKMAEKDIGAAKFYLVNNEPRYMTPAKNHERRTQQRKEDAAEELEFVPIDPQTFGEKQRVLGEEYEDKLRELIIKERLSRK